MLQHMRSKKCHVRSTATKPHKSYGDMICLSSFRLESVAAVHDHWAESSPSVCLQNGLEHRKQLHPRKAVSSKWGNINVGRSILLAKPHGERRYERSLISSFSNNI